MRWGRALFHNFWPKLIALVLAIATWFYVFDLVNIDWYSQRKETVEEIFSRFKFTVKEVPVKPLFIGKTPSGYRVAFEKVKVDPPRISIFGPEEVLEGIDELSTEKINLGEYTKSVRLQLGIQSDVKFLNFKDKIVDVYLPVKVDPKDEIEGAQASDGA
ncbi:CdaR family protein [Candidatus Omnitrophota bacterium]